LLVIIFLGLPLRVSISGAILGVAATLAVTVAAIELPTRVLTVMDARWLDVVRERSQFLFLQLWSIHDWEINAQSLLYLAFTAIAVTDPRVRKLCTAAALVGAAGLAIALIGGLIGPVAILVQGQAWRWIWISVLLSALLVPLTALRVWRENQCGPFCALLLMSGWTLPGIDGVACVGVALIVWLARPLIGSHRSGNFRLWSAAVLGVAIATWTLINCWPILSPATPASAHLPVSAMPVQYAFAMRVPAVLLGTLIWWGNTIKRKAWLSALFALVLAAFSALICPAAFRQPRTLASGVEVHEFSDWAKAIPATSTVLITPSHDAGGFVWFTLARPNYLTLDQSAGVVFSRATALEIRRRSEILLPLLDPDWKILSSLNTQSSREHQQVETARPLTAKALMGICTDPQLGFVISPEKLGFDPLPDEHTGTWKGWNLYDCRKVRSVPSPACSQCRIPPCAGALQ
jgi:hypothetical protein